jgi:hypothetical protein
MNQSTAWVLVVAVVAALLIVWMYLRRRRTVELHRRFGPEYDRVVKETGTRRQAEAELENRTRRVEQLAIRPLPAERRERFNERWQQQQSRFVDEPKAAVDEADHLVEEVMRERGYPVGEFEQRAADISVTHPRVVQNYRAAHDIATRERSGQATTDDLRRAMILYRDLFMDLLEEPPTVQRGVAR